MRFLVEGLRRDLRRLRDILLAYLLVLVLLDLLVPRHHPLYWFDEVFGFWAAFGVVGCFVLAKGAKGAAHLFLSRKEDYYGEW